MHAKSILIALAVSVLTVGASIPQNNPLDLDDISNIINGRDVNIIGGNAAGSSEFPFVVSIQRSATHICGGALLNANTVVTAAHCLASGLSPSNTFVRAGSIDRSSGGIFIGVSRIVKDPRYSDSTRDFDIAILKLSTPIPAGGPIGYATLPASGSDPVGGSTVTVAGWGAVDRAGASPLNLQKVSVPVIARLTCQARSLPAIISNNMFCTGQLLPTKGPCQGDDGSPIFDSSRTLIGVVSRANGCTNPSIPNVYTRIGALLSFINSV